MNSLRYLVRAEAPSGALRLVTQCSSLAVAKDRANVTAMREDTVRAFVLDLESPVGRGFKIVHEA